LDAAADQRRRQAAVAARQAARRSGRRRRPGRHAARVGRQRPHDRDGRMSDPFSVLSDADRALLKPAARPDKVEAMKAVLTDDRFSDDGWIFERKLDGIRCLASKAEWAVWLRSRNDLSLIGRFPEVAEALAQDAATDLVIDGEVVAFAGSETSFERLQQRGAPPGALFYYLF